MWTKHWGQVRSGRRFFLSFNHPQLGAIVDAGAHRKWSYEYNQRWAEFFSRKGSKTTQKTLGFAQELAKQYGFKWGL